MKKQVIGWLIFGVVTMSFLGGILGGFLGVGFLDGVLFDRNGKREVVLEESSVIIDTAKESQSSVVSIEAEGDQQRDIFGRRFERPTGAGTGVIVTTDGIVLTNRHVVPKGSTITVTTDNGNVYEDVEVIDRDPFIDIAYLQLEGDDFEAAETGDSDHVEVGQRVIAIGNALGQFRNTVTSGIISGIGRPIVARGDGLETESLQGLFQTDAAINEGNSGGPLLNIEGQVVGINTAVAGEADNIGFAIPINQVTAGLETVREEGRLIKPFLGVRYRMLTPGIADEEGLEADEGAYLPPSSEQSPVVADGPAEAAGLQAGDIIIGIDDMDVTQERALGTILSRYQAGETIEVTFIRSGEEKSVSVELDEAPTDW